MGPAPGETIRARFGTSISTGVVGNAWYEQFGLLKVFAPQTAGLLLGANCQLKENSLPVRRVLSAALPGQTPWPAIEHPAMVTGCKFW
jgi:hypothetical protein